MKKPTVVDVLQVAQMYVARGWIQGPFHSADGGQCCLAGALHWCEEDFGHERFGTMDSSARELLERVISYDNIISFNEIPGRTQDEVLDAFSKAIELAEASDKPAKKAPRARSIGRGRGG